MSRKLLLAATLWTLPLAAQAQPVSGPYVGLGVGWNYLQQEQIKGISVKDARFGTISADNLVNRNINFGSGLVALGSAGWGFGNGLRIELEGDYRGNYRNQNGQGPTFNPSVLNRIDVVKSGGEEKAGIMVNALYDFVDAFGPGITPYIGAGVGWQHINFGKTELRGNVPGGPFAGQTFTANSGGGIDAFAYQAIIGASYNLASVSPNLYLTAEYRFMAVGGDRSGTGQFIVPSGRAANVTISSGPEANHAIIVGARYAFNAPPPPPLPSPPPVARVQESRSYLVFFDWDRADLTDRARQIVAEAATASTHVQTTVIEVKGYTDRSGTAAYNQKLSVRRAENVAMELVKDGVPKAEISVRGYGETNPLVSTAKGVREPQNRRVEIVLH